MKVLLDECVTKHLKRDFPGYEVSTVKEAGFKGLKNGQLLKSVTGKYDVLVTVDRSLTYQQNLKLFSLAIIVLATKRNTYTVLKPLMPQVLTALDKIKAGDVVVIRA
jgi:hypothetical protein